MLSIIDTMRPISKKQYNNGFTLLEVMLALAVIAIALTALMGSQSQSLSLASEAKFRTTAALLAQGKMARIEIGSQDSLGDDSGDFGDDFPGYHWSISVDDSAGSAIDDETNPLKQVRLTVTWGKDNIYTYSLQHFMYFAQEIEPK